MEASMQIIAWTIAIVLMLLGLLGTLLPVLPGSVLILLGAGVYWLILRGEAGISWPGMLVLLFLTLLSAAVDLLSTAVGAKWFGATRWGAIGAVVGGIVGLFFGLIGVFVGPFVGAILFEIAFARKKIKPAGKSGVGTVIGGAAGMAAKIGLAILMIAWFLLDVLVIE